MSEQLRLEHALCEARAVHGEERARRAVRQVVDRPGDELLSGAGLARHEHRGIRRSDSTDGFVDFTHGSGTPDHAERTELIPGGRPPFQQFRHFPAEQVGIHGLGEEVVGSELQRLDSCLDRAEAADHQDGDPLAAQPQGFEHSESSDPGHPDVEQQEVDSILGHPLARFGSAGRRRDFVPILAQQLGGGDTERPVIVDQQDAGGAGSVHASTSVSSAIGSSSRKIAPDPSARFRAVSAPP